MTDLHEAFGALLESEPEPTRIDPYAAARTSHLRTRTRRHRWLAGGVAAALVVGIAGVVAVPRLGMPADETTPPASRTSSPTPAVDLDWISTPPEGTAATGMGLDITRTLAQLDGAATRVQQLLGLPAAAAAEPYPVPRRYGALQLAYRTSGDVEVHVLLQGPLTHPVADCAYAQPPTPDEWPQAAAGERPTAPHLCGDGTTVATTYAGDGRIARTVAAWGTPYGQLSVTITSDAGAAEPASLAAARRVVDLLAPTMRFHEPAGPDPQQSAPE